MAICRSVVLIVLTLWLLGSPVYSQQMTDKELIQLEIRLQEQREERVRKLRERRRDKRRSVSRVVCPDNLPKGKVVIKMRSQSVVGYKVDRECRSDSPK